MPPDSTITFTLRANDICSRHASFSQGGDCDRIEELIAQVAEHNREALHVGGIMIACGMARYEQDGGVAPVFERADHNMYENKNELKARRKGI